MTEKNAALLPPPPISPEKSLPLVQRRDVWGRVLNGMSVTTRAVSHALNPARRERCRFNLLAFATEYFPHKFVEPTAAHLELVGDYQRIILSEQSIVPTYHAEADPRGFGKTTIGDIAITWTGFFGHRRHVLFAGSTGPNAGDRRDAVAAQILTNQHLAEDFPEIVGWLKAAHNGEARRAPPHYPWSGTCLRLPNGVVLSFRGLDTSLTGTNIFDRRPDLVIIDDAETLDVASSATRMKQLEERITLEVMHVHERGKPAAYFFINTIRRPNCIAQRLTDPKISPQWHGRRRAALIKEPTNKDLWDRFIELCGPNPAEPTDLDTLADEPTTAAALKMNPEGFSELTEPQRNALCFYAARKDEMDAGAELLDPLRLPLYALYLERAKDETAFQCELQNNPPEDKNRKELQLDVDYLMNRRVGGSPGVVPAWASVLTATVDIGAHGLHWQMDAWDADLATSCMVAQGIQETNLNVGGRLTMTDEQDRRQVLVQGAIDEALQSQRFKFAAGLPRSNGDRLFASLIGVDCGGTAEAMSWYETILRFCVNAPRWIALKGVSPWQTTRADRALGRNWICEAANNPGRRHDCNSDEYKSRVARAFEAPARDKNGEIFKGARVLHSATPAAYCRHQTAEWWVESIKEDAPSGKAVKVGWNQDGGKPNHWWDTSWMAFALVDILRSYQAPPEQRPATDPSRRPSLPSIPHDFIRERF